MLQSMNTEHNATAGRIYGRVERVANDLVVFIAERGRRILFRYVGMSLQYPSAAEYRCTQCPLTALMINANFLIVDPCAGHDCSVGACSPQWTPPTVARTAIRAWQPAAMTAIAFRSPRAAKSATKVIAEAVYDARGFIQWRSERHQGTTLTFRPNKPKTRIHRRHFYCSPCESKCSKYKSCLAACGIKRRYLIVLGKNIIDHHPDDAGTNRGHLCQQPLLEETLQAKKLEMEAAVGSPDVADTGSGGHEDAQLTDVAVRTSIHKQDDDGSRADACQRSASDRTPTGQPFDAKAELSRPRHSAADESTAEPVFKAAVADHDGSSDVDLGPAVDALDEALQYPESIYSVSSVTQCATGSRANSSHQNEVDVSTTQLGVDEEQKPRRFCEGCAVASVVANNHPTPTVLIANSSNSFAGSASTSGTRKRFAGSSVDVKPTIKSPEVLTVDDSDEDNNCGETPVVSPSNRGESLRCSDMQRRTSVAYTGLPSENTYSISSAPQHGIELHESESQDVSTTHLTIEEQQKPHCFHEQRDAANTHDSNNPTQTTLKTKGASRPTCSTATSGSRTLLRGSSVRVKPSTKKYPDLVTINDSDVHTGTNGSSSSNHRASMKPVKQEHVENNNVERLQQGPASARGTLSDAVASVQSESGHLTVRYTPTSGMILNATHASAQMKFVDFRQIFNVPQNTRKVLIFKRSEEEWDVIREDDKTLPAISGHVEAKVYSEN